MDEYYRDPKQFKHFSSKSKIKDFNEAALRPAPRLYLVNYTIRPYIGHRVASTPEARFDGESASALFRSVSGIISGASVHSSRRSL